MTEPTVDGFVAPGFEPVAEAFRENFRSRGELGAAFCVHRHGEKVVDLWGGLRDRGTREPWTPETAQTVFSTTKGIVAACFLVAHAQGRFDYDELVAGYWPEFAQHGKGGITIRTLLNHRSGCSAVDQPLTLEDLAHPGRVARACEAQVPMWEPGTAQGYGATAWGMFAGELFRRIVGTSVGTFLREHVAGPAGADVWIGLPEGERWRVATLYPPSLMTKLTKVIPIAIRGVGVEGRLYRQALKRGSYTQRAVSNPAEIGSKGLGRNGTFEVQRLELPWANAVGSARGISRLYASLLGGERWDGPTPVPREVLAPVLERQTWQECDHVMRKPMGWSQGFIKDEPHLFSPNVEAFGHPGVGGALGFADPVEGLAMGYVPNAMSFYVRSPRAIALCHAVFESLGKPF